MRKFYVATKLENGENAKALIRELEEEAKWQCTYDWTLHGAATNFAEVKSGQVKFTDVARDISAKEMDGVGKAQVVIVLLPGGRGTHVELGAAIASGKQVFIVYNKEEDLSIEYPCVFYWHPRVVRLCANSLIVGNRSPAEVITRMAGE